MNRDTVLLERPDLLLNKKIYICGAGIYGHYTLKLLRMIEIYPIAFIDKDNSKVGMKIDDIPVLSYEDAAGRSKKDKDMLLILSSAAQTGNMMQTLGITGFEGEDVYSLFALFFCVYFNREVLFKNSEEVRKKCDNFYEMWKFRWGDLASAYQGDLAYNAVIKLMMCGENVPVLIDQPGKVGSHTIEYTLENEGINYLRFHGLSYKLDLDCPDLKKEFRQYLRGLRKIKIITLVREPISKDFGHFFQKISVSEKDFIWFCKGLMEENLTQSFYNYLSVVTPLDFTKRGRKYYTSKAFCHIDYIGQTNPYGANWGFFDDEFKGFWGVDLLDYPFNIEKGYEVIREDNLEILVLRLDKLNNLEKEIGDFLGIDRKIDLVNGNVGDQKDYGRVYKELMHEIQLPKEYIDYYYKNNKYTEHFFSEEEMEKYRKKWEHKDVII